MISQHVLQHTLQNAVNEAKIKLGLSNSELSKLIGHSRNYISETLRIGASTEKQAEITGKIKEAVAVELVSRGVPTEFLNKDHYEQELRKKHYEIMEVEKLSDSRWWQLQEEEQNVRMLNMEVEQLKQKHKCLHGDFEIAKRDKNFMKKKLQDKNAVINWLVASNVFFILFLVAKCVGWV